MEPTVVKTSNFVQKPRIRGADFWGTLDSIVEVMHQQNRVPCYELWFYNPEKERDDWVSNIPGVGSLIGKMPPLDKVQKPIPKFVLEHALMNVDPIKFYQGTAAFELPVSYSGELRDIRRDAGICPVCNTRVFHGVIFLLQQREARIRALEDKLYGLQEDYYISNTDIVEKIRRDKTIQSMLSRGGSTTSDMAPETVPLGPEGDYGE